MQIAGEEIERLRRQIMEQIDLTRTVEDEEVYQLIEAQVRDFARERMLTLGEREAVVQTLFYSLRKLDVLQELLEDPTITEIMVNGAEHIFYEKAGRLYKAEYGFSSKEKLNDVIQQMAGYSNRMVNEASPIVRPGGTGGHTAQTYPGGTGVPGPEAQAGTVAAADRPGTGGPAEAFVISWENAGKFLQDSSADLQKWLAFFSWNRYDRGWEFCRFPASFPGKLPGWPPRAGQAERGERQTASSMQEGAYIVRR